MSNAFLGVFPYLANDDYHSDFAIGASGLKRFLVSPLHYWADYLDPEREPRDTTHFRVGRAWHCAVFEPAEFASRYVPMPEGLDRRTKEGKALWAEIEASGRDALASREVASVEKMAGIARALPISRVVFNQLAQHGAAEASLFTVDPATGLHLKIRPDYMLRPCPMFPNGLIIDGKTTTDASASGFARQVWNLDYGLQAALYTSVYQSIFDTAGRPAFLWLAQEKNAPHAAAYYSAGVDLLEYWDKRIAQTLPAVARCQESGVWPGFPETVTELALPTWAQKQVDEEAAA